jgi:formylglycine-generating enzyme required for sulfatase activity
MAGNVAEWCSDAPGEAAGDDAAPGPGPAAIKGGAWLTSSVPNLRPAARNMSGFSNNAHEYYGFRCARDR